MTTSPDPGRPVSASRTEMTEIVMPNDANPLGNAMGGMVMHWIDICAAIAAGRHARTPVVTAHVDQLDFRRPVPVGSVLVMTASVNYAHRTSMEVGVKVIGENPCNGTRVTATRAFLTFVAINADHRPVAVPPLTPQTDEEQRRWNNAALRVKSRKELRQQTIR